jgi:hypothetical protein
MLRKGKSGFGFSRMSLPADPAAEAAATFSENAPAIYPLPDIAVSSQPL